jgi:hypothetical protein
VGQPLTADQANAIYDVLVEHAGASEHAREEFVLTQTDRHVTEYRFQGALGFGGKFWRTTGLRREDPDLKWSVSAYPEDMSPERQQVIDAVNRALAALNKQGEPA